MLEIKDLKVQAGKFRLGLSWSSPCRRIGIYGPSGAGKTTFLETMAGLRRPMGGSIQLNGTTLDHVGQRIHLPPECRRIGYVPQDGALFPHRTVEKNLLYGCREKDEERFQKICSILEIAPFLDRFPESLSGGERQRVALGRAVMTDPRLLVLDEPLAHVDRSMREKMIECFKGVESEFKVPLLYVSHDADEIVELCETVMVLNCGKLIAEGEPGKVFVEKNQVRWDFPSL